jgi:hypothetical protein
MPILAPQILNQRLTTYEAVQKLLDSARFSCEKAALAHIWTTAREFHQPTGFQDTDFRKIYQNYRKFKKQHIKKHLPTHLHTFSHDNFPEDHI